MASQKEGLTPRKQRNEEIRNERGRKRKRNRMKVSVYIRQRLFVHNYISEADEREYLHNIRCLLEEKTNRRST